MIRHRPLGRANPYRTDPDQRVPARPVAGEPIELRVTTDAGVERVIADLEVDGRPERLALTPFNPADAQGSGATDGHLAAAATGGIGRGRRAWRVQLDPYPASTRLRYRFEADDRRRTRRFEVTVAGWWTSGGHLVAEGPPDAPRLLPNEVQWLRADAGPIRARFALPLKAGAHVVGFGERFDRLDQRGERLDAVVFDQYKSQGKRTYLPIPFAIVVPADGSTGWGFHVRTARRTWYDIGASDPERLVVEVALDPDEPEPTIELALYAGSPSEILAAFLAEAGLPAVPPDWIYRPWMSGNEWNTQARIRTEVERTIAEEIPAGVVVIEAWSDETTIVAFRDAHYEVHPDGAPHRLADFSFPPDGAWPDPKGLVDWLHSEDIRVLLWQVPLLKARPAGSSQGRADRDTLVAREFGVLEGNGRPYHNRGYWFPGGLMPDWTNPEAKAWWLAKRRYLVEELGIDGFKTDGGEHAWGDELRYADGTRGSETNNHYPVLYAAAYQELMASCDREPVTFSRAGFTGAATVPCHWAGDEDSTWEAFRASITAGLTAGASGVFFWGWDLAGFSGEIPSAELYVRSTAMAAFCPIMQYHSEFNHHRRPSRDRTPWNIAERTGDPQVLAVYRRFARLRERLVPYLADQGRRSAETRRPLMRALCFDWPDDPVIWDHPFEYLLGDDLLVAPVTEPGTTSLEVYLPAGRWIDAWTGAASTGPRLLCCDVPLGSIPVFIREGAARSLVPLFAEE